MRSGVERWRAHSYAPTPSAVGPEEWSSTAEIEGELFTSLPRPAKLGTSWSGTANPPQRPGERYTAGSLRTTLRLLLWLGASLFFAILVAWDSLRRRNTIQRRAQHLRRILEGLGGTSVKFGQQASMRIDLLPYAYCHELEKMLDRVKPFPVEEAVAIIERSLGRPLPEIFRHFDPDPIGSASVSCVYQAVLLGGERVAVKVLRPGIGKAFVTDIRALSWVMRFLELLVVPPGFTRHFIYELQTMLMDELNFAHEARYTELFRREVKKAKFRYAKVPKVHFTPGIHLTEVIAAVEQDDQMALAALRERKIDPRKVARRMLRIVRFSGFEGTLWNADPHPANIMVQPGNRLVFIDFGACGSFTEKDLVLWRRLLECQSIGDVGGMVQAVLGLLEPLARIDVDEFTRKLEGLFWQDLYAFKSKHAKWWERTSANLWVGVLQLVQEYEMHMNLNTLRMIRATMLSDSLAARLDSKIDHYKEYQRYAKGADKRAFKRFEKKFKQGWQRRWRTAEQLYDSTNTLLFRAQRWLDQPAWNFGARLSAEAVSIAQTTRGIAQLSILAFALVWVWKALDFLAEKKDSWPIWGTLQQRIFGQNFTTFWDSLFALAMHRWWFQILVILFVLSIWRRVRYRIEQKEV